MKEKNNTVNMKSYSIVAKNDRLPAPISATCIILSLDLKKKHIFSSFAEAPESDSGGNRSAPR